MSPTEQHEHVFIEGAETGPVLVFLHEGLGSVAHWRDWPAQIAERTGLPALVYSRRGYGTSARVSTPRPATFLEDEAQTWLPALLDAVTDRPVLLVGHSDGASIALLYAALADRPDPVGLVAIAPHVFVEDLCVAAISAAKAGYRTSGLRERLARYHHDVDHAFLPWADVWVSDAFRSWDMRPLLPRITCPVLLVQGIDDAYGTLAHCDAVLRSTAGAVDQLVLGRCGHSPPRERAATTADAVVSFVRRLL